MNTTQVSQKDLILSYLHQINPDTGQRRGLSQMEALGLFRIARLASRIEELRDDGHDITTEMRTDPTRRTYARYFLNVRGARAMPRVRQPR
jgi:hypothetical protein